MKGFPELTAIDWIGLVKKSGDEWSTYSRTFYLEEKPELAVIRADSYGVCGIYINGEFVEATTGRFPRRISCIECTSRLRAGENEIVLKLGNHFYPSCGEEIRQRRGAWFSAVAAELLIENGQKEHRIVTDKGWTVSSDDGQTVPEVFSAVTQDEYERFWKRAAYWAEPRPISVPEKVLEVAGDGYRKYVDTPWRASAYPKQLVDTSMEQIEDGSLYSRVEDWEGPWLRDTEKQFALYDFGRLEVGYLELEYETDRDGVLTAMFDYTESPVDFEGLSEKYWPTIQRLFVPIRLEKGHHRTMIIHRRACRYLRLRLENKSGSFRLFDVHFRLSMMPYSQTGWFHCEEDTLNEMWEVGKYTLHVNKHQEYESCPRNEMKFFAGDGILDALVDYYTFGDPTLTEASLSLTEISGANGIRTDVHERNVILGDYAAWRVIMVYNQYRYFGDKEFVARYYEECVNNLDWMAHRAGSDGLIYQYPVFGDPFYVKSGEVEYNSSYDRLGEKPLLNALFYRSLICMSEMAVLMDDERGAVWKEMAQKVRKAFNERLWSEEEGIYLDLFDTDYLPQDGNAVAIMYGLAEEDRARRTLDTLRDRNWTPYGSPILSKKRYHTRGGARTVSPLMCTYEAEARFRYGKGDEALELLRHCWGTMLKKGAGTFWEWAPNNGKDRYPIPSHAWSSGCAYILSAFVLGVQPGKPGYEELHFEPYAGLETFAGVVPTTKGLVGVRCETLDGRKVYRLAVPDNMKVDAVLPPDAELRIERYQR